MFRNNICYINFAAFKHSYQKQGRHGIAMVVSSTILLVLMHLPAMQ